MHNIFTVKQDIEKFGMWYALHRHGFRRWWTIWCATRMIKHNERHYQ
jgi:hypothetical protein